MNCKYCGLPHPSDLRCKDAVAIFEDEVTKHLQSLNCIATLKLDTTTTLTCTNREFQHLGDHGVRIKTLGGGDAYVSWTAIGDYKYVRRS